ncbi:hypothetical protein B0H16DRAFT_1460447 [Mycena metata]|uniref:Uncharacterized protein n=1 Tax=Mycena metata TaxID=1033252 RepID=A0AAD7IX33_9AGAR|nr:hypothetical protein B0H16DRAFT_1460447 [Mycena metata]
MYGSSPEYAQSGLGLGLESDAAGRVASPAEVPVRIGSEERAGGIGIGIGIGVGRSSRRSEEGAGAGEEGGEGDFAQSLEAAVMRRRVEFAPRSERRARSGAECSAVDGGAGAGLITVDWTRAAIHSTRYRGSTQRASPRLEEKGEASSGVWEEALGSRCRRMQAHDTTAPRNARPPRAMRGVGFAVAQTLAVGIAIGLGWWSWEAAEEEVRKAKGGEAASAPSLGVGLEAIETGVRRRRRRRSRSGANEEAQSAHRISTTAQLSSAATAEGRNGAKAWRGDMRR